MTIPLEIRQVIWKYVLPELVEVEVPGNYYEDWHVKWRYISLPPNPLIPLLLINKQARKDLDNKASVKLVLRAHETHRLSDWLNSSTFRDKKLVREVRVDRQWMIDCDTRVASEVSARCQWYIDFFGDDLVHCYREVETLRSGVTTQGTVGILDVTFEVGEPYEEKLAWESGRFHRRRTHCVVNES